MRNVRGQQITDGDPRLPGLVLLFLPNLRNLCNLRIPSGDRPARGSRKPIHRLRRFHRFGRLRTSRNGKGPRATNHRLGFKSDGIPADRNKGEPNGGGSMPYVLMIRERQSSRAGHGQIANTHATWEEAHAELVAYVRENWNARMDEGPPKDDEDELIVRYFEQTLEEYDIAETANNMTTGKP